MNRCPQKQCILIIDDTPMQLVTTGHMLSPQYDVKMAKTGAEGIALAKKHNIDLILLDLMIPDVSGFNVLKQLKQTEDTKNIPVIFITGDASIEAEEQGLAIGAVDYIRKPFSEVIVKLRVEIHLRIVAQMKVIENISLTDGLTGIGNRRSFDQMIRHTWNTARRLQNCFGMLMLDIDKFKNFNETYGHLNGDICLKTVASIMSDALVRECDNVYRWGGEEFVILLPSTDIDGAMIVAENIRDTIAQTPIDLGDKNVFVTVSTGVGSIVPNNMDFDEAFLGFLTKVNQALFQAKNNGRNRVEKIFS
ncbi:MAG: diguanylate cyclase [Defluviitaleaceae bacterium]|nr:diguanylate cyclase [Defluviitaleaceae bacterium]